MTGTGTQAGWNPDPTGRHQFRYWDGAKWTDQVADQGTTSIDPPTMPPGPVPPPGGAKERGHPTFSWLAVASGVGLAIGSLLKAVSASVGAFSASKSYIDGDGPLTLIAGVAIVGLGIALAVGGLPRWGGWIVGGLGGIGAVVALVDLIDAIDKVNKAKDVAGVDATVGPATPVCLFAGLAALVFGILTVVVHHEPTAGPPAA
jgi:hypothetical protein